MKIRHTAGWVAVSCCWLLLPTAHAQVGRDWGVLGTTYVDSVTGVEIRELTAAGTVSDNLYFHFSNFTADDKYVIFASDLAGGTQIFRADVATGRIVQLTDGKQTSGRSACPDPRRAARLYHLREHEVWELDIESFAARKVGEIPEPRMGGYAQPTLNHDGTQLALGKQCDAETWEIGLLDLASHEYRTVLRQGFRIGHAQHSPTDPVIFYVWETGGYAPQRTWLVNADGTGNRPFYVRTDPETWFTPLKEWITHEAWVHDTGQMTMINDKQGVMLVDLDGTARMVSRDHYWHAAARADGKFLVLDDFEGRLWLVETSTGNRRLLATGLRQTVRVHPHPSFDRGGNFVQFHTGRTHETVGLIDLRKLPPQAWR
jgi:oligogalacturonide lyase